MRSDHFLVRIKTPNAWPWRFKPCWGLGAYRCSLNMNLYGQTKAEICWLTYDDFAVFGRDPWHIPGDVRVSRLRIIGLSSVQKSPPFCIGSIFEESNKPECRKYLRIW